MFIEEWIGTEGVVGTEVDPGTEEIESRPNVPSKDEEREEGQNFGVVEGEWVLLPSLNSRAEGSGDMGSRGRDRLKKETGDQRVTSVCCKGLKGTDCKNFSILV